MKNIKTLAGVALLIITFTTSVNAGFLTGNDLLPRVRAFERTDNNPRAATAVDFNDAFFFLGYVTGVADMTAMCGQGNLLANQAGTVVAKYFNAHPEKWNEPAQKLVTTALREAFPCRRR